MGKIKLAQQFQIGIVITIMEYGLKALMQQLRLSEKIADTEEQRQSCRFYRNVLLRAQAEREAGEEPGVVNFATAAEPEIYPTQLVRGPDGGLYMLMSAGPMVEVDLPGFDEDEHEFRMRVWEAVKARRASKGDGA